MEGIKTNLTFEEAVQQTVEILDKRIQEVNNTYDENLGPESETNQEIMAEVYKMCNLCNVWLRMVNAPEDQLYDI